MGMITDGWHLKVSRTGTGQSVFGTCVGELRGDGGSRYMVWIEWTCGLAFGMLGFNLRDGSDSRHAGYPWERYNMRNYRQHYQEKGRHLDQLPGGSGFEDVFIDVCTMTKNTARASNICKRRLYVNPWLQHFSCWLSLLESGRKNQAST